MKAEWNFKNNAIGSCANNQNQTAGSYQKNYQKKVSMLRRPQGSKQAYQQFKEARDMTEYTKDKIRENYEMYEKGQIDKDLLKRNIKHKLYLPINEKEIDLAISQNKFDFKVLLKNVDNQKYISQSPIRQGKIQSYNLADNTEVQQSMNLKNYRSLNEGPTNNGNRISDKEECIGMIKDFIDGYLDKGNLLRNLKKLDIHTQELFDNKDINNDRYEPNSFQQLGSKVLRQFRERDSRSRENQTLNQQKIIERCLTEENKDYLKSFNQTENLPKFNYEEQEDQFIKEEMKYDFVNGQVRLKLKKVQERCPSACKTNGDIITWKGQERNIEREQAIQDRTLKIKKFQQSKQLSSDQLKQHLAEDSNFNQFYTPSSSTFYNSKKKKNTQNQSAYLSYNNYNSSGQKNYFRNDSETTSTTYQDSIISNKSKNLRDEIAQRKIHIRNLNSSVGELMNDSYNKQVNNCSYMQ